MKAEALARPYPLVAVDAPAQDAARLLAAEDVDVLLVVDADGEPVGVLHDLGMLRALLPPYLLQDRALTRVVGESVSWDRLSGRTVADLLDGGSSPLPSVPADAPLLQVAAEMCSCNAALVAVRGEDGRVVGGVTSSAVITALLDPS